MNDLTQLNSAHAIPGMVKFEAGEGGLARIAITTPLANAHIYLQGAHVTHYQPAGQGPVLFVSARSQFAPGKAIRGGIPVIFPWFGPRSGDPAAPQHGFARSLMWDVQSVAEHADGAISVSLTLPALTFALAIDRVLNGFTRPFFGWVSDHIGRENTMFIAFFIEVIGIYALLYFANNPLLFVILSGLVFFA